MKISLEFEKAFFKPGETARWQVTVEPAQGLKGQARLIARISHLAEPLAILEKSMELEAGRQAFDFPWQPGPAAPQGYRLDVRLESPGGELLAASSAGFDVLAHWTQSPRYGFLTDFTPGREDSEETIRALNGFHINAFQFYDWMYRHDQFLTPEDPYLDPLGRPLSRRTVEALIEAAHQRGMAAMPYTAVYGASLEFYRRHPDWVLYGPDGKPSFFYDFLTIMDPRPGSPWTGHLLDQFDQVLAQTAFDGLHLDQYGEPRTGYDAQGRAYDLAGPLAALIDAAQARVQAHRPNGAVVFNAVANWPVEQAASAGQDLVYIEVWPPDTACADLHRIIVQAQALGKGKPVVLAVYLDPECEHNVRLVDSILFASGAGHIELGERDGMLADPYFPKYRPMSVELEQAILRLYEFAVRYQDVTGPRTQDDAVFAGKVAVEGAAAGSVWPIVRQSQGLTALNLIRLPDGERPQWKEPPANAPARLEKLSVQVSVGSRSARQAWLASPDHLNLALQPLTFNQRDGQIEFELPGLEFWDLVLIDWIE